MQHKRLTLFAGHYGSGKTNIAVNYALHLAGEGKKVCIADLDIVNPYFRTKDSAAVLEAAGIHLVSPQFANTNVDLPALPAEAYRLVTDKQTYGIMDIGGDDRGAYALGRYVPAILKFTDLVNNTNLGDLTTPETVLASQEYMEKLSTLSGLPVFATTAKADVAAKLGLPDVLPLTLQEKYFDLPSQKPGNRPLWG